MSEAAHDWELRIVGPSGGEFNKSFFVLLHFECWPRGNASRNTLFSSCKLRSK